MCVLLFSRQGNYKQGNSTGAERPPLDVTKLSTHDDTSYVSIAKACGIDMKAATTSICKMVDSGNYRELAEYCPSEANAFEAEQAAGANSGVADSTADTVINGARKLKSLFGF